MRDLIEVNRLTPPYHLRVGQLLTLPTVGYHVVVAGDTVYGISRRYRVDMTSLVRANGLRPPYTITVGQSLSLPGNAVHTARVAAVPPRADPAPATAHRGAVCLAGARPGGLGVRTQAGRPSQ